MGKKLSAKACQAACLAADGCRSPGDPECGASELSAPAVSIPGNRNFKLCLQRPQLLFQDPNSILALRVFIAKSLKCAGAQRV